jgi:hypothetical protein
MGGILTAAINTDLFFPWVDSGGFGDNVGEGIAFAAVGLVGAMVTAYYAAGGFLPSMGGKAEYDAMQVELSDLRERFRAVSAIGESFALGTAPGVTAEQRAAATESADRLSASIDSLRLEAQTLKRSLLARALPFYLLLGAAFAVLFAQNLAQALLIGFAWTLLAERMGLKKEMEKKDEMRGQDISKLESGAKEGERHRRDAQEARADAKAKDEKLSATEAALKAISDEFARVATASPAVDGGVGENGSGDVAKIGKPTKNGKPGKTGKKKAKKGR